MMLMLTDGFEEAVGADEEMLGNDRVLDVVRARRDQPARDIVQALYSTAREFSGNAPQLDDLTAIVIKVK